MAFIQRVSRKKGTVYKVHYTDPVTGRRRTKSFNRRKDADAFIQSPKISERYATPDKTVGDAIDHWLHVCEHHGRNGREPVAQATLKSYIQQADRLRATAFPHDGETIVLKDCLLVRLDKSICTSLRAHLIETCSWSYARRLWVSYRSLLQQAREDGLMDHAPSEAVHIRAPRRTGEPRQRLEDKMPSLAEVKAIFEAARARLRVSDRRLRRQRLRYSLILETMAYGGTRPGEALGLPWSEIDFDRGGIRIIQDVEDDGTIGLPKSDAAYRFIPMPDRYMRRLHHWRKLCPSSELDLVFPNWSGKVDFLSNLNHRGWRPILKQAGVWTEDGRPKYPPKSLRHVRASLEIERNANPKEIKELMGHSSIRVTFDIYGHLFDAHNDRRASRANDIADLIAAE
ncbi:MAG: site-specific integrase [Alphaproteobacteria bacterium]|nr:site-specific integrase [Alphaproteobacteria bacterium]